MWCTNNPFTCLLLIQIVVLAIVLVTIFIFSAVTSFLSRKIPWLYNKWYKLGQQYMNLMLYHCHRPPPKKGIFADPFYVGMFDTLRAQEPVDPVFIASLEQKFADIAKHIPECPENCVPSELPAHVEQLVTKYRESQAEVTRLQLQLVHIKEDLMAALT